MLSTKLSTQGFNTAEDISEIFSTETVYNLRQKITASFDYLLSGSLVNNWPIFFYLLSVWAKENTFDGGQLSTRELAYYTDKGEGHVVG